MGENVLTGIHDSTVVDNYLVLYKLIYSMEYTTNTTELNNEGVHLLNINLLGFFISQICWVVVLWIVKCSILAFYWRLFSANGRSTRFVIWTITVAVMCWGIAVVRSPYLI